MRARIALAGAAVLALAACAPRPAAPPRPDESAIRTALTTRLAKFIQAVNARDTAAAAELVTRDAVWIGADASIVRGRAGFDSALKAHLAGVESLTMRQTVIEKLGVVSDSEAFTFSRSDYTFALKGKRPESRVNLFADEWKKGLDGVWRVAYEVNADGPAPVAPPMH